MLVLDIWAGNTSFGKKLKNLNPQIKTVICGDIRFQKREYDLDESILENLAIFISRFSKVLSKEQLDMVVSETKSWVFKVFAKYADIPFWDESVDIVTLNSPHPLMPVGIAWFEEIQRVLKKWGIFYFWHSMGLKNWFLEEGKMKLIGEGDFRYKWEKIWAIMEKGLRFPVSPIISKNLLAHYLISKGESMWNQYGYIYWKWPGRIPLNPNWKAWEKVK